MQLCWTLTWAGLLLGPKPAMVNKGFVYGPKAYNTQAADKSIASQAGTFS